MKRADFYMAHKLNTHLSMESLNFSPPNNEYVLNFKLNPQTIFCSILNFSIINSLQLN